MGRAITRNLWIFFISLTLLSAGCGRVNAPSALDAVVSELAPTATPTNAPEPTPAEAQATPPPEPEMDAVTFTSITPAIGADGRVLFSPYYLELPAGTYIN